jgi:hypothetical protein
MNTKHISKNLPSCEASDQETSSIPSTSLQLPFLRTIPTTQKPMGGPYPLWDQGPTHTLGWKRNFSRNLIGVGVGTTKLFVSELTIILGGVRMAPKELHQLRP